MRSMSFQWSLNRRAVAIGAASAIAASRLPGVTVAQEATPEGNDSSSDDQVVTSDVLLTGLADPRFVVVDGTDIYFTESGIGGDEPMFVPADQETPVSQAGPTGKVSRLAADGTVTEIASDLMSYTFGAAGEIVGPAGLALDGEGSVYVAIGAPGPFVADMPRTGEEGVLVKIDIASGERSVVADLIDWEITQNPDPMLIDSNPYGMSLVDGIAYIADAGGNTIIAVDVNSGEISTFAVTAGLPADFFGEDGNPGRDGEPELDSVPSAVEPGPDGRLYVGYVTGGPFPAGYAPIDAFSLDGEMERVVEGLTMTADIAFDSSDRMYVSIVSTDLINGGAGQVVRIEEDGATTIVVDGLALAAGIAFDSDDNLYVINNSSMIPGGGELVRYSGVTNVPASGNTSSPNIDATPVPDDAANGDGTGGDDSAYHIAFVDMAFEPNALTIPANIDVTLTFENMGYLAHDFVIANPKIVSEVLGNGQTSELIVNLPAGEYPFYCAQIGHRAAGMEGILTVV